jgi:hypothetical protein
MLKIHFGTVQFQTPQVKNFWNCSTKMNLKLQHHNVSHYSPAGNGDILDIVVHQNIELSSVTVSNILDSDHLPIIFHILDHVKIRKLLETTEKFTDWERFQSLASDLISPRLEISMGVEANEAVHEFTASIASVYRLLTSKVKVSEVNTDLPGLDWLLKQKQRLRKLWQETRDPACKTAVKWVTKAIRQMTHRRALERWETKIANTDVTPQANCEIPHEEVWSKETNCNSWSFRPYVSPVRESQRNY